MAGLIQSIAPLRFTLKGYHKFRNYKNMENFPFAAVKLPERGLGGLVVIHSAASVKGSGFNSPVARAYLRFNSRTSTLAGKQY